MRFGGLSATALTIIGLFIGLKICWSLFKYFFHGAFDGPTLAFQKFFSGYYVHKHSETGDGVSINYRTRFGRNVWMTIYHTAALVFFFIIAIILTSRTVDGGYWLPVANHELLTEGDLVKYDGGMGKIQSIYINGTFTCVSIDCSDSGEENEELLLSEILYRYIPSDKNPLSVPGRTIRFIGMYAASLGEGISETLSYITGG